MSMRSSTNSATDRKIFKDTATKAKTINYGTVMRGGIRL